MPAARAVRGVAVFFIVSRSKVCASRTLPRHRYCDRTLSAESHVEDEAAWHGGGRTPEKFVRGFERFDAQAYGAHKHAKGKPDSLVIVDDVDDGTLGCCGFSRHSVGRSSSHPGTSRSRNATASRWHVTILRPRTKQELPLLRPAPQGG